MNKEIIALNQDEGFYQGRRLKVDEKTGLEIWEKKLGKDLKGLAIVLYNPSGKEINYTLKVNEIGIAKNAVLRDLWAHKDLGKLNKNDNFTIPKHGVVCLKVID